MRHREPTTVSTTNDVLEAAGNVDGDHSWGFGSFLYVDRVYEGELAADEDPSDVRPPWLASIAS